MKTFKYVIFALLPAVIIFAGAEIVLRAMNFKYSTMPLEMRSLSENPLLAIDQVIRYNNRDGVIRFVKDPKQFWVPVDSPLARYPIAKPADVLRIATLGCSCTAGCVGTQESYPSLMEKILNEPASRRRYEVLNAGVGSYSSYQGLQRLKYAVLPYRPDVLTVFFGWNDHWIGGLPDNQLKPRDGREVALVNFMEKFRVYQWLNYTIGKFSARDSAGNRAGEQKLTVRVPMDLYAQNLNVMIDVALANGMKILFVTAPYDFTNWKPASFFPFPKEYVTPLHQQYNQVVRHVALSRGIGLLDLEKIVAKNPAGAVLSEDGIHFHEAGCGFVAQKVADELRSRGWV